MEAHWHTEEPVTFNLMKHHRVFAEGLKSHFSPEKLPELLKVLNLGNNLPCDYYFGVLNPDEIIGQVKDDLQERGVFLPKKYRKWLLNTPEKFRNVRLSDGSEWTLLLGKTLPKYIHVHPARYSPHTIRVRFLTLKTALLFVLLYPHESPDYEMLNQIRTTHLHCSPLKAGSDISHISQAIRLMTLL